LSKKYLYRGLVWSLLIIILTFVTYNNYHLFITNSVEKKIEQEEAIAKQYEGKYGNYQLILNRINNYNNKIYDDNKYSKLIPDYHDEQDVLLNYVERPILIAEAELLSVSLTEGMPKNIVWSTNANTKDIKGIKVSVSFNVTDAESINTFINELQTSVRTIYFGDIKFTLPGENAPDDYIIKVTFNYYLFYRDVKTT